MTRAALDLTCFVCGNVFQVQYSVVLATSTQTNFQELTQKVCHKNLFGRTIILEWEGQPYRDDLCAVARPDESTDCNNYKFDRKRRTHRIESLEMNTMYLSTSAQI